MVNSGFPPSFFAGGRLPEAGAYLAEEEKVSRRKKCGSVLLLQDYLTIVK